MNFISILKKILLLPQVPNFLTLVLVLNLFLNKKNVNDVIIESINIKYIISISLI